MCVFACVWEHERKRERESVRERERECVFACVSVCPPHTTHGGGMGEREKV